MDPYDDRVFTRPNGDDEVDPWVAEGGGLYPVENATHSDAGAATGEEGGEKVSVWTIYIIVGAVSGGILVIGLVAIVVALCWQKDDGSGYKSTSV
jgi:hypothetical protein